MQPGTGSLCSCPSRGLSPGPPSRRTTQSPWPSCPRWPPTGPSWGKRGWRRTPSPPAAPAPCPCLPMHACTHARACICTRMHACTRTCPPPSWLLHGPCTEQLVGGHPCTSSLILMETHRFAPHHCWPLCGGGGGIDGPKAFAGGGGRSWSPKDAGRACLQPLPLAPPGPLHPSGRFSASPPTSWRCATWS